MKLKLLIAIMIFALYSCKNKENPVKKNIIKTIAEDTLAKTAAGTANVSDTLTKENKQSK